MNTEDVEIKKASQLPLSYPQGENKSTDESQLF